MLAQRRRRWVNINQALAQYLEYLDTPREADTYRHLPVYNTGRHNKVVFLILFFLIYNQALCTQSYLVV